MYNHLSVGGNDIKYYPLVRCLVNDKSAWVQMCHWFNITVEAMLGACWWWCCCCWLPHYGDVTMGAIASQITSLTIVYSIVYSDADQRKHQSSASLAFVQGIHRGPVNSPHKWPVTRKMFPFDDVIMRLGVPGMQWRSRGAKTLNYSDVTMGMMASPITSLKLVYSTVYSGADERKHQSSASPVNSPVNSPHRLIPRTNDQ